MVRPLRVVHVSSEISPYSKSGGLADVVRSLSRSLRRLGHKVMVITPYYGFIRKKNWPLENLNKKLSLEFAGKIYKFGFKKIMCPDNYPVFFVCQEKLFGSRYKGSQYLYNYSDNGLRFLLFDLAALELIKILKFEPQIIHCHDWHAGLIPNYLKIKYKDDPKLQGVAVLFTIHNLLFQGPKDWWKIPPEKIDKGENLPPEDFKKIKWINFTKRGILYSDIINTVSVRHAQEILTPEFGNGLDGYLRGRKRDVFGVVNGIDYTVFNPKFDKDVYVNYDLDSLDKKIENKVLLQRKYGLKVSPDTPLIGLTNRLTEQKGFKLIVNILDYLLLKLDLQIAIVGSGRGVYADLFRAVAKKHPKRLLFISPFREDMDRKILAASDICLMPSRFEPCGISQLKSLRYGSVPIVHAVGGLMDTVSNYNPKTGRGNGFVFTSYESRSLLFAIARTLENYKRQKVWKKLVRRAMQESYSWKLPAKKYATLYRKAIRKIKKEK